MTVNRRPGSPASNSETAVSHELQEIRHTPTLGSWSLTCAQPGAALSGDVAEYWEVQGRLGPFREAVLPNGRSSRRDSAHASLNPAGGQAE